MEIKFSKDVQLILEGFTESARWEYVEIAVRMQMKNDVDRRDIDWEYHYDDMMARLSEEIGEGYNPLVAPSPLLSSSRAIRRLLRDAGNETSFRYLHDENLREFAQYLHVGVVAFGWRVISNDGEKVSLVREGINEE